MNEIVISEEMLKKFEALRDQPKFEWTPETEALLLKYWTVKKQADVCKLLGVTENPARRKYRELTE